MADVTKEIVLEVGLKDSTAAGTTSAKTRLRELQKTLADMALAGQDGTKAFRDMEREAGKLKDQIGDTQQRIKNLASDTRTIDTFVGAIQGITAGFQIAQGAAALFGAEEEELQKSLVKVQAAMALANGVQQVANLLNKDSILITQAQAAAQRIYAFTLGQSTIALRVFRTALVASGVGIAVAGLGLLLENWDKLSKSVKDFFGIKEKEGKAAADVVQTEIDLSTKQLENQQKQNDLLAKQLRLKQEIENLNKEALDAETQFRLQKIQGIGNELQRETLLRDERLAILEQERQDRLAKLKEMFGDTAQFKEAEALLNEQYRVKAQGISEASTQKTIELKQKERDTTIKFASEAFTGVLGFIAATKGQSEADARKAFNLNKAAGIADATINTYLGASQVLRDKTLPTVAKAFAVAGIIASGLTQVRKIAATQFQGGGAGSSAPSPSAGGSSMAPPPTFTNPQTTMLGNQGESIPTQGQQAPPMRAYVVERDIQQTTSRVRRLSEFATLG